MSSPSLLHALRPAVQPRVYELYDALRADAPCRWDRALRSWVVTGYAAVAGAARDPRLSSVRYPDPDAVPAELRGVAAVLSRQMLYRDPPDHARLRGPVSRAFAARAIAALRPRIGAIADGLVDDVAPAGACDVVADIAEALPARVIGELLDLPAADLPDVVEWSRTLAPVIGGARMSAEQRRACAEATDRVLAYLDAFYTGRADDADGPVADLLAAARAERMTRPELLANTLLIFLGGHETTTHFLGNAVVALLADPAARARFVGEPEVVDAAVEELLRYDPPVQLILRRAAADLDLAGARVAAGDPVLLVTAAANRDPAAYPEPGRLDFDRAGPRHLTFGHGAHFCLGAGLARLESGIALRALFTRLPDLARADDGPLEWLPNLDFRGLTRLPVRFTPVAGRVPGADRAGTATAGAAVGQASSIR
ncbi:cytochrome P450 hydroxylase [Pilimelia anulata]|uniref:Cytochrome P450 hydroxylase n=1 Tax=Pilimelia anulata TaxID=53371 RepID=A0A8J3B7Y3_9ACTN|nr:cytochrome P450 [Pilimelia anulata]GGJ80560.1 cytochrome P450 hydroxylase [Pilimelia anulata]